AYTNNPEYCLTHYFSFPDNVAAPATSLPDDIANIYEVHLPAITFVHGINDRFATVGAQSWM
ncbi:unnamed protein product, partial [marine sediment metagenome]